MNKMNTTIICKIRQKLNDIDFTIESIETSYSDTSLGLHIIPLSSHIKMSAITSNKNLYKINEWFDKISNFNNYKIDTHIIKNSHQRRNLSVHGIFPTDYTFQQDNIKVLFSVDYIKGDLSLFLLNNTRKEKLEKLSKINKYGNI